MIYDTIIWDFDGTLVDTSPGIIGSLQTVFTRMGMETPPLETLQKFIGPPMLYGFETFVGFSRETAERAVWMFREDYETHGLYISQVFPGLEALVRKLRAAGLKNAVATLKPEKLARRLLEKFEMISLFDACCGSGDNEMGGLSKAQIIGNTLTQMDAGQKTRAVLVGDTIYDAQGAAEMGIDFVAVAYGFGLTLEQAQAENCVCYAKNAGEIEAFLEESCQMLIK